jgi:hypothetical protein
MSESEPPAAAPAAAGPPRPRRPSIAAQYIIAIIIYAVAFIYVFHFALAINKAPSGWKKAVNDIHEGSVIRVGGEAGELLTGGRGSRYIIGVDMTAEVQADLRTNVMTFWGFTHFTAYTFLGLFCPDLFWQTFAAGCLFETYEYKKYKCQDLLDIIWNTVGFAVGRALGDWARAAP